MAVCLEMVVERKNYTLPLPGTDENREIKEAG
jgi:hypothetical protein